MIAPATTPPAIAGAPHPQPPLHCTDWVTLGTALMSARGSPMGAAAAAPANMATLVASKADTAKNRSEVDMVVSFQVVVQIVSWRAEASGAIGLANAVAAMV